MAMASVSASLEAPYADRHSEGSLTFEVMHTAMAGFGTDFARKNEDAVELSRLVERGLRESRAVDLEALCVQPGRKVWHLQVDVRLLDNCGNATDAVGLAALGALCAFRRPDVTVDPDAPGGVIIHSPTDREPLPLTLHHLPLPISFAFFEGGELVALDPLSKEEAAASGSFTVTMNPQGELCAAQKAHGVGITPAQILQCMRIAATKAKDLTAQLRKALEAHEVARVAARVRRHQGGGGEIPAAAVGGAGAGAGAVPGQIDLSSGQLDKLQLPEDVRRFVEHAAAQDSSEGEEQEESSEEEEESDDEAGAVPAAVPKQQQEEGDTAQEAMEVDRDGDGGAAAPQLSSKPSKSAKGSKSKTKRRRSQQSGEAVGDPYGAIADMIVNAGGGAGGEKGGLEGAVKRKTPK